MVFKELNFNCFPFQKFFNNFLWEGVVVLKELIFNSFLWEGVVVLKDLIFNSFLWEGVVVLKELIFNSFPFGRVWWS